MANYGGTLETTHYIGGLLEILQRASAPTEYRHQIPAGSSLAIFTRRSDNTSATYYATSDHLGSADLVLDASATVLTRESYTPFGARRGSNWQGLPTTADYTAFGNTTRRGFTGHEMLDSVSLVHMNGRVYDPYLGRFTSADTVIQNLAVTASINPFSYAWNDPLRYTDPSGHSLLGAILGIVAAIITVGAVVAWQLAAYGATLTGATLGFIGGFVGGFVGALVSTGSLSAALTAGLLAGITGGAFGWVGDVARDFSWTSGTRVLAHAAVGCGSGMLSGGNCGKGAAAAALGEAATQSGLVDVKSIGDHWGSFKGAAEAGLVGGAAAAITGGSFNDGFSTAAAGYLFNAMQHENSVSDKGAPARFEIASAESKGNYMEYKYQLTDADGNALTGPGYKAAEFISPGNTTNANGEYRDLSHGVFTDHVGWRSRIVPITANIVTTQWFSVTYRGLCYPISTVFQHIHLAIGGVAVNPVVVITP